MAVMHGNVYAVHVYEGMMREREEAVSWGSIPAASTGWPAP